MTVARRLLLARGGGGSFTAPYDGLRPSSTVSAVKNAGNPTFNFDAIPESVVKVGSTYWCVYQSWAETPDKVRLASSPDLVTWTGQGVIYEFSDVTWAPVGATSIYAPELIEDAGTFYLVYSIYDSSDGSDGRIGIATASSVNGTYTDHGSAILTVGTSGAWDSLRVSEPSIFRHNSEWVMAYMGEDTDFTFGLSEQVGIATATSPTGPWTKAPGNPLITYGSGGEWDDELIADPFLWWEGGYWWIWYSGGGNGDGSGTRPWSSGLAYATDPTGPWTKHADNPILSNGTGWEEKAAWRGSVFRDGDGTYHVVYGGLNNDLSVAKGGNAILTVTP